jgi:ribosomal-protein-alanine N-acetyltransferase
LRDWELGSGFVWSIELKTTGSIVGQVSLFPRDSVYALAFWIKTENHRNGYATEACLSLIEVIKLSGYKNQLWAGTAEWNKASAAVLRNLNFRSTGSIRHILSNGIEERINEYVLDL